MDKEHSNGAPAPHLWDELLRYIAQKCEPTADLLTHDVNSYSNKSNLEMELLIPCFMLGKAYSKKSKPAMKKVIFLYKGDKKVLEAVCTYLSQQEGAQRKAGSPPPGAFERELWRRRVEKTGKGKGSKKR